MRPPNQIKLLAALIISNYFASAGWYNKWWSNMNRRAKQRWNKKHVIFSTDSSGGSYGPNAGYDECPSVLANGTTIPNLVNDRDVDDLMAITLAINSKEVVVDLIVPVFGNANMPANFLTATQLVNVIKEKDIPIVPGASDAAQPVFIDTFRMNPDIDDSGWGGPLLLAEVQKPEVPNITMRTGGGTIDPLKLFAMSCQNRGVVAIEEKLKVASRKGYTIDILGIGPMTDVACLLLHADERTLSAIGKLVLLIGQEVGVQIVGSTGAGSRDFNMVMDPLGATIVLSFSQKVPIVLMQTGLTFITTNDRPILFGPDYLNQTSYPHTLPFFLQAKKNALPNEGPFDQYVIAYSLHPEWFQCASYPAFVIQCDPVSPSKSSDDSCLASNSGNTCTSSDRYSAGYTKGVSAELTIDTKRTYEGNLVIGNPNGNILNFQKAPAARVTACTNFIEGGYEKFRDFVYQLH